MKVLVEIQNESKIPFIMEFSDSQPYLKATQLYGNTNKGKTALVKKLKKASKNLQLYKKGTLKTISAKDFLNEI